MANHDLDRIAREFLIEWLDSGIEFGDVSDYIYENEEFTDEELDSLAPGILKKATANLEIIQMRYIEEDK